MSQTTPNVRPHARHYSLAVGHRAQARTLREVGPDRLRCGAFPRRRATRHPLDVHRTRAVAHGALLSDGSYGPPATAEAAPSPEHTGCPQSRVSAWVPRYTCGADDERDPALFLVSGGNRSIKIPAPRPNVARHTPFLLKFFFLHRVYRLSFIFWSPSRSLTSILQSTIVIFSGHKSKGIPYLTTMMTDEGTEGGSTVCRHVQYIRNGLSTRKQNVTILPHLEP